MFAGEFPERLVRAGVWGGKTEKEKGTAKENADKKEIALISHAVAQG